MPTQTKKGQELYAIAAQVYRSGTKVIADNAADDYGILGCAETVNELARRAWGAPIGGGLSTAAMWECLKDASKFAPLEVLEALPGDIIISPTGSVQGAKLAHGHVGVVAEYGILSNDSELGSLQESYDMQAWQDYYTKYGGLPTLIYRPLDVCA